MPNDIDRYMGALYSAAARSFSADKMLSGEIDKKVWREELRVAFLKSLGQFPDPVPLNRHDIERAEFDDHTRIKLKYTSERSLDTIAYLLIPKGESRPRPAVVACTGHGYGVRDIVGLNEDFSEKQGDPGYQKNFALELVRRGYVVIAPEPLGFGEMMLERDIEQKTGNSCMRISCDLLLLGRTMAGVRAQQYISATSLLSALDEVDRDRIGAMGISGGGLTSSFLAMLDPRIRAVVVSGYPCMFRDSIYAMYHCIDNFPWGLLNIAECDDLMALIAPRPMLWESGSNDPIFPRSGVIEAEGAVRRVYEALGAGERFAVDYFEGEHEISGRLAYGFFEKYL